LETVVSCGIFWCRGWIILAKFFVEKITHPIGLFLCRGCGDGGGEKRKAPTRMSPYEGFEDIIY
jgi:hypothetical protein